MKHIVSFTLDPSELDFLKAIKEAQSCSASRAVGYAIRMYHTVLKDDGYLKF